jgi:hypothetical protein
MLMKSKSHHLPSFLPRLSIVLCLSQPLKMMSLNVAQTRVVRRRKLQLELRSASRLSRQHPRQITAELLAAVPVQSMITRLQRTMRFR